MIGMIGKKIGMNQTFDENGRLVPVTVLHVPPNLIVGQKTKERDGYASVLLAAFERSPKNVSKSVVGQFPEKEKVCYYLSEFRDFVPEEEPGTQLDLSVFTDIGFVDVQGLSKGKGFQGVMRRHGFHGGRKTHGSKFHRAAGSTGMAATPSRVLKGTKMAGRAGGKKTTMQNLRVVGLDVENSLMYVCGSVPGTRGAKVLIHKARKKQ